ncbi:MAG: DUF480 domain-containing protein [Planctomycetes bacterium]|nr:DUF480 domain-containing protein [Planctomycetota bacterium]
MSDPSPAEPEPAARWQTLEKNQRRVVGVLVEKAKTTPENYPLTLNGLINGSNQKSNRYPQMQLEEERVEEALDQLRAMGAVALIEGDGRVDKHRHLLYDWLGVDKMELAVMAELLLRGAQTLGELRGRAARMEPIRDIGQLRPIVDSLRQKGLLILLTPSGRGCIVTHALYQEQELVKLRAEYGGAPVDEPIPVAAPSPQQEETVASDEAGLQFLRDEVASLRNEVGKLRSELQNLNQQLGV